MKRKQWISGIRLYAAGLAGHFKKAKCREINMDAILLDSRQYKRFKRAENIALKESKN